ncbi:MAG: DNA primase [Candidatus Omnitrophica bacterium]|nr:DNA primase [Candidatus Omnitrophota bacterium]
MGLIPQEIISQILDRANIVEVIAGYIPLKQAGRNFKAPCPFHHEKTPSFVVNSDKQIFHCFGCGVGGNVVTFVMKQEKMEYPEALRFLAEKTGIEIPATAVKNNHVAELRQQILSANDFTSKYYHRNLISDKSDLAKTAREYLKGRGLSLENVTKFQLGLALEGWDGLLKSLREQNFSPTFLEKAGLVIAKNQGAGHYDRFRERIIFPILNARSEVVAFGARSLSTDNPAKYINSPETPLYTKGNFLYGLNWAKDAVNMQDAVIVVEGYMDFISPFAAGVENIVASLGTALTVEQIRLIRRYTKNIVMLFDADPAGQAAMMRSLDLLVEEGMTVKIAALTTGEDPDSFVRKFGAEAFVKCVENAQSLFDFKVQFLTKQYPADTIEGHAKIAGEMLTTIAKFDNAIIQAEYLKKLSHVLMVDQDALSVELKKVKPSGFRAPLAVVPVKTVSQPIRQVEHNLLRLMLEEKDFVSLSRRDIALTDLQNTHVRDIVAKIFEIFDQGREPTPPALMSCFEEQDILDMISGIVASEDSIAGDRHKMYRDCTLRLRQENQKSQRQEILRQMEVARNNGDHKTLEQLSYAFNQLIKGT